MTSRFAAMSTRSTRMATVPTEWKPPPLAIRSVPHTLKNTCDVCGRRRGGGNKINHSKCSAIRKAREN
ncbi:hypothetical protein OF001_U20221 [Pseudomonas sp. OF001]|nr:hypothetical protein OF001_U20221 [Pseudomonas sp. OF001]